MFPLPTARTYEEGLPSETGTLGAGQSQSVVGQELIQFIPPPPSMG